MRLLIILTLGLGACGPMLVYAEKIVFVVPRYVRRSYSSGPVPFYRSHKVRHPHQGGKRPYIGGHHGPSDISHAPFFPDEKPRAPQGGDDFDQGYFTPKEEVNHVIIPHGKGISHGISFGKGYIPRDEFKGGNENYGFPSGGGNNLEYSGHNHQGDVKFEEDIYSMFKNQDQIQNGDWPVPTHQSSYDPVNYDQETNQEESNPQLQEAYKNRRPSPQGTEVQHFFPRSMGGEESQGIPSEDVPSGRTSGNTTPVIVQERKPPAPIILRDTVDMKEYVEQVEAFAKTWPSAAALQGFGWKNQILNPPSLTLPNYQGFNSWTSSIPRPPAGSYQVQEDSVEEPSQRSYRTVMM